MTAVRRSVSLYSTEESPQNFGLRLHHETLLTLNPKREEFRFRYPVPPWLALQ